MGVEEILMLVKAGFTAEQIRGFSEKAEPEKAEPEKAAPEKAEPEKAAPEKAEPEKAAPEKAEPEKQVLPDFAALAKTIADMTAALQASNLINNRVDTVKSQTAEQILSEFLNV